MPPRKKKAVPKPTPQPSPKKPRKRKPPQSRFSPPPEPPKPRLPGNPARPGMPAAWSEEEVVAAVWEAAGILTTTARLLGVSIQTICNYQKKWPAVKQAFKEARRSRIDFHQENIDRAALGGDWRPSQWFLDRQARHLGFGEVTRTHLGGDKDAPPIQQESLIDVSKLPLHLRRQLLEHARNGQGEGDNRNGEEEKGEEE